MTEHEFIQMLIRRGLVTTDPAEAEKCCGLPRDHDGFCILRHHPIYFNPQDAAWHEMVQLGQEIQGDNETTA